MATVNHKKIKYRIKPGAPIPANKAQVYGECLHELAERHEGRLDAEVVVSEAKNPHSVIHDYFEWDNRTAAEEYRKEQARRLLRYIVIVEENSGEEVRAFFNVKINDPEDPNRTGAYYVPTEDVLSDEKLTAQVLEEALDHLKWFRKKYALLKDLSAVHRAIDQTMEMATKEPVSI